MTFLPQWYSHNYADCVKQLVPSRQGRYGNTLSVDFDFVYVPLKTADSKSSEQCSPLLLIFKCLSSFDRL